ncbi:MAG: hypothetical protein P4L68_01155, partial [Methylovirgula sp.]|nr:hypothetical protein [Methylovirgula sp.]
ENTGELDSLLAVLRRFAAEAARDEARQFSATLPAKAEGVERLVASEEAPALPALDHDDFGSNRSKIMNVIDSKNSKRDFSEKPESTFSHSALEEPPLRLSDDDVAEVAPAGITIDLAAIEAELAAA